MKKPNRHPKAVAALLILNGLMYANETGRDSIQYRFKDSTLRKLSRRTHLQDSFRWKVMLELAGFGWTLVWPFQETMGLVKTDRVMNWVQLSSKRLSLKADSLPTTDPTFQAAVGQAIGWDGSKSLLDLEDGELVDLCQEVSDLNEDSPEE